jgi:hypothetical protein
MDERVGTVHRTVVLDLLSQAVAEGYLDLNEYEQRMTVVTSAKTASVLMGQLSDLPPQFRWDPRRQQVAVRPPRPGPRTDNTQAMSGAALILGIVSIPMAMCFGVGAAFGIAAVVLSLPGVRATNGWGLALAGRILGICGIVLSLGFFAFLVLGVAR